MALIACPECDDRLSTHAEKCPHCGYPYRRRRAVKVSLALTLCAFAALVAGGRAIHTALAARRSLRHRPAPRAAAAPRPRASR